MLSRPGGDLLRAILEMDQPEAFVRSLPPDDFFRMVKRIGEEDALPALAAASDEQWQYLLDLETWRRDSLDAPKTLAWLGRLARANATRLAEYGFPPMRKRWPSTRRLILPRSKAKPSRSCPEHLPSPKKKA